MIISGSELAREYKDALKEKIALIKGRKPCLCVILVGNDKASLSYIASKQKASHYVGIDFILLHYEDITEEELIKKIKELNDDDMIDGILVQLPLPIAIDERRILNTIDPDKDVDGLTDLNAGRLSLGEDGFVPCTPLGIMAILLKAKVDLKGKEVVVIGRSNLVGLPVSRLLLKANATVTVCHSKTEDLKAICQRADVLVVAIGRGRYIDDTYVKDGAVVIDVGINHIDGKLCGDVDFDKVAAKASLITPVPKGVGPMTVCMLMENVYRAYMKNEVKDGN